MNILCAIATAFLLFRSTELQRDKCPIYDSYPEQILPGDEDFPEDNDFEDLPLLPVIPEGDWFCWAVNCPGHVFKVGGQGCKMNFIVQFPLAIFERIRVPFKAPVRL